MLIVYIITHYMLMVSYSFISLPFHVKSKLLAYIISPFNGELLVCIITHFIPRVESIKGMSSKLP